jgi:hypothetical protein
MLARTIPRADTGARPATSQAMEGPMSDGNSYSPLTAADLGLRTTQVHNWAIWAAARWAPQCWFLLSSTTSMKRAGTDDAVVTHLAGDQPHRWWGLRGWPRCPAGVRPRPHRRQGQHGWPRCRLRRWKMKLRIRVRGTRRRQALRVWGVGGFAGAKSHGG